MKEKKESSSNNIWDIKDFQRRNLYEEESL